jgi:hypothetical protein
MHRPIHRMIWPATGSTLKVNSAFTLNKAPATFVKQSRIAETVVQGKTFPKWDWVLGCAAEVVGGFLVAFYLLATLALGAAVLFFTFFR